MSSKIAGYRRRLRHEILEKFQGIALEQVYEAIRNKEAPAMVIDDLKCFCDAAGIPVENLPAILAPYRVSAQRISLDKFKSFLDDEVLCKGEVADLTSRVTDEQAEILASFTSAVRTRSARANAWVQLVRLNQPGVSDRHIRLATLCRLVDDYNLSFSIDSFIDAVFAFFGEKLDELDYDQFTALLQAFA